MRIAVASEGLDVSSHFSCCTNFNYYKVENSTLADSRNLPSQGHLCGSQANFLRQIDVKVLLCGSISERDIESMNAAGITVVPGVSGRAIDAAFAYLEDHAAEYEDFIKSLVGDVTDNPCVPANTANRMVPPYSA